MRNSLSLAIVTLFSSVALAGGHGKQHQTQHDPQPPIQQSTGGAKRVDLVIALDTSSSMDGLIDSARGKLWDVVNLLAHAKPQPLLRVGLISYGNDGYDARAGWVRKDAELTTNLDDVYEKLFALRTNGGSEYVARAVHDATARHEVGSGSGHAQDHLRRGQRAGQPGPADPRRARARRGAAEAASSSTPSTAAATAPTKRPAGARWRRSARASTPPSIRTASSPSTRRWTASWPSCRTSSTRPTSATARWRTRRRPTRQAMDSASGAAGAPVAASRAAAKASSLYRNDEWDLVDARAHGKKDVEKHEGRGAARADAQHERVGPHQVPRRQGARARRAAEAHRRAVAAARRSSSQVERKKQAAGPKTFDDAVTALGADGGGVGGLRLLASCTAALAPMPTRHHDVDRRPAGSTRRTSSPPPSRSPAPAAVAPPPPSPDTASAPCSPRAATHCAARLVMRLGDLPPADTSPPPRRARRRSPPARESGCARHPRARPLRAAATAPRGRDGCGSSAAKPSQRATSRPQRRARVLTRHPLPLTLRTGASTAHSLDLRTLTWRSKASMSH